MAAVALTLLLGSGAASAAEIEANLKVIGRWEAVTPTSYGDVAVIGTTAIVATGACPAASATVVDLKTPGKPAVLATIPAPPGMTITEIDAMHVGTESFTGDLVAIALSSCGGAPGGMTVLHDLTDPARPRVLGQTTGSQSVSLAQRPDGPVLAAGVNAAGVVFDDVSNPADPVSLARWTDPRPAPADDCRSAQVFLHDEGSGAVVTIADGRVYAFDLTQSTSPSSSGEAERGHAGHIAVMPLGNRTIAIVAEEDPGCAGATAENVLRVLTLEGGATPLEEAPVRFPAAPPPGRILASGTLAYVAWHADGLRVIDFGEVRARTVAQFVPEQPDVVGVALLPQHVVVTDRASGLYVLDRPEEAGGRAGFWSQFLGFLPYLGGAMLMAAMLVVPRLAMGRSAARSGSRVPSPVGRRPG